MQLYSSNQTYKLFQWNMLDLWEVIEPCSIDSIVTDPPYELNFMWKWWDNSWIAFQPDTWKKCLDALKPWGYLLAFWGSRTYHRIACAIEDAGFEIRDCIMWLYGSWFPKSLNLWNKVEKYKWWGTCLKPSYEPIIVARKPLEWSCTDNVIKYWVGGINIDECRVETQDDLYREPCENGSIYSQQEKKYTTGTMNDSYKLGRFPANTIIDEEVAEWMPMGSKTGHRSQVSINNCIESRKLKKWNSQCDIWGNINHITEYTDSWSVARYFYCAKASKRDRDEGLDEMEMDYLSDGRKKPIDNPFQRWETPRRNVHPTVKPTSLMQYLVRLVTPNGWTVLDPFNWSGSTWKAVMYENKDRNKNYKYIWIELTEEYLPIAKARIEYVINKGVEKSEIEESKDTSPSNIEQWKESALF